MARATFSLVPMALCAVIPLYFSTPARAQVTNDWLGTNSGVFSTGGNWATNTGPVPADGLYQTNLLRFFGGSSYAVTNDFATTPFQLHGLRFQVGGAASTLTLSGGALEFLAEGTNPAVIFQNGIGRIAIQNDIVTDTDLFLAGGTTSSQRGNLTNSGLISGTGRLIKAGIFTNWLVNAGNTFSGGYVLAQGRTFTESPVAAGSTPLGAGPVTLAGGTLSARMDGSNVTHIYGPGAGYDFTVISNATFDVGRLTTAGTNVVVQLNAITNLAVFTVNGANGHSVRAVGPVAISGQGSSNRFNNGGTLRLEGLIGELTPGSVLDKSGGGTLTLTNLQNHTYSGGTIIRGGTVTVLTTAAVTNPLGTGGEITMYGGTLALRDTASRTVGSGANINGGSGYHLTVAGTNANAVVDVNRYTGTSQNSELRLNNLTLTNGASFQVNGANNYTLAFLGGTFLGNGTNNVINVNNGRSTQPFSLRLAGPMTAASPATARLIKQGGYNELGYVNGAAPDHQGGTWITAGGITWRPAGLAAGSYGFGGGTITLDNGASFRFQNNQNNTYTLTNDFFIQNTLQTASGRANFSGGRIDTVRQAANPLTVLSGNLDTRGDVKLNGATGGAYGTNNQPLTLTGTITARADDLTIFAENDGDGTGERIVIRGPLTSDNLNRRVKFATLNGANLELSGNLTGLGSAFVTRGYAGNGGYVKFTTTNSVPAGGITVAPGAAVSVGMQQFLNGTTAFSTLTNRFHLAHGSMVLLDRTNVNGTITYGGLIDLSATGVNRDIRLGAGQGFTTVITNSIFPFADTYKLGAGEGVLQFIRTNQFTGTNRLNVGPDPGFDANEIVSFAPLLSGTVLLNTNNDFTGGTLINPGATLDTRHTNALGAGAVTAYGVLSVRHGGGTLTADGLTNLNLLTLQAGSTLQFENNELTVTNRFGDAESLVLNGATLRLLGRNAANQFNSEFLSNLVVNGGSRLQTDQRSTGGTVLLGFTNLSRGLSFSGITNGTLQLVPNRDGVFGTTNRILIADTANLGAAHNGMLAPWIVNQGAGHHYLTYDTTQLDGFDAGLTNFAGYFTGLSGAGTGAVANVSGLTDGLTANQEIWALRLNTNSRLTNNGNVLTLRSGGLLAAGNATNDAHLAFRDSNGNPTEGLIYVNGTLRLQGTNDARIITKFGDGNLQLGAAQPGYTNGWNVNRGTLSAALGAGAVATGGTDHSLGSGDPSNFVNLNGNATLSLTSVGTNITYASGKITSWDNNIISANLGNQDSRRQFFAPLGLDLNSISNGPLGSQLRVDLNRTRSELVASGPVTLNADSILNLRDIGGANLNTGSTNRLILAGGLVGNDKLLVKIGNAVLELPTDNSSTFTGGQVRVQGGALSVGHNGALGDAATTVTVTSNAVLELNAGLINFQPLASIDQQAGSAERWLGQYNRFTDDATPQTYVVPTNVTLQIAHAQNTTAAANSANKTIRLQGGGLEGWQFTGDSRGTTLTISNQIEFTSHLLLGRSDIDVGRGGILSAFNGSFTEINPGLDLVKVGGDIVQLGGGTKNYTGNTRILNGELRNGTANAIATGSILDIGIDGKFNLNNFAQTVAGLAGSGALTNSGGGGAEVFTVNGAGTNAFSGSIGGIMALTKSGSGTQVLSGRNTFTGATDVSGGTLELTSDDALGGTAQIQISTGGTLLLSGSPANRINDLAGMNLAGGSFQSGGLAESLGALTLSASSTIDLGSGASTVSFTSGTRSTGTLTIDNWSGSLAGGGTDQLRFDTALDSTFLANINFTGFDPGALQINFGSYVEVVPVPEPATVLGSLALASLALWRERRCLRHWLKQ